MNEYTTTDMDFSTVLYCLGKKIIRLESIKPGQKAFVFSDDGTIDKIKLDYINGELRIEPRSLWNSMKAVKSMLYSM